MEQPATDNNIRSVEDLWCAAVAADRINDGYFKHSVFESVTANKTLVREMLIDCSGWSHSDKQTAQQYHQYWRNQMLLLLDDSAKDYDRTIAKFSSKDTVDISGEDRASVAVIASAVQTTRERIEQEKLNKIKTACDRKYIGNVGDKINITARVISCRWVDRVGAYIIEAVSSDNCLVAWWKARPANTGDSLEIRARIRSHTPEYHTGVPATQINYTRYRKIIND